MQPCNEQTKALILNAIERLINEGGSDNFAIFNLGTDYYIQVAANKGATEIYCEAVGNNFLNSANTLDIKQWDKLSQLGWESPQNSGNYHLMHSVNTVRERENLATFICTTAHQIYGVSSINEQDIVLNLG